MPSFEILSSNNNDEPQIASSTDDFNFFGWNNAGNMLESCGKNTLMAASAVALGVAATIIFVSGFTTCSTYYIDNKTSDYLLFTSYSPRRTQLHDRYLYPYGKNNITFASGKNYANLRADGKTFHLQNNGEASLSGTTNSVLEPTSIFFFKCYCDYKKGDNTQPEVNATATPTHLRGAWVDVQHESQWLELADDMLTSQNVSTLN